MWHVAEDIRSIKPDNVNILMKEPAEAILKGNAIELILPKNVANYPHWDDVAGTHGFASFHGYV